MAAVNASTESGDRKLNVLCWFKSWWPEWGQEPLAPYGLFGDYVGGVFGTIAAVVLVVIAILSWRKEAKQFRRTQVLSIISEMLKAQESITSELVLPEAGVSERRSGRAVIGEILAEFYFIYQAMDGQRGSEGAISGVDLQARIDIAFCLLFFGPSVEAQTRVSARHGVDAKKLFDHVSRTAAGQPKAKNFLRGHQDRLGHYFRSLFAIYSHLDSSKDFSQSEKYEISKIARVRLSNYEQALLALNMASSLGEAWRSRGICKSYQPIKNIPKTFFSFDEEFDLLKVFPEIRFEFQEAEMRSLRK